MEWLTLLVAHPGALASFRTWLQAEIRACEAQALEQDADIPSLRGMRDSYRKLAVYVNNNMTLVQHDRTKVQ